MPPDLTPLRDAVRHNCLVADARHARDHTLCTYLLKMREYYRWEKGYALTDPLPKDELGRWLTEREQAWEALEEAPFIPLPLGDACFDPFDSEAVNRALLPFGLVYSGGMGSQTAPHFFLGRLLRREEREGFTVLVSDREELRDLSAPPAMTQGRTLFVRRESLRRLLWERIEEWNWKRAEGPMERALAAYPFERAPAAALEVMTDRELETALWHELGEGLAGSILGEDWHRLLWDVVGTQAELVARAVRDHLADALYALPRLLEADREPSLHFYFANLRGMRRELYPELLEAYRRRTAGEDAPLASLVEAGRTRWREAAEALLELHRRHGPEAAAPILAGFGPEARREAPQQPCACTPSATP